MRTINQMRTTNFKASTNPNQKITNSSKNKTLYLKSKKMLFRSKIKIRQTQKSKRLRHNK